ncbi:MAG TPA: HAD-IA family hydrolase [Thermoanaerobaculia bacterium]|nr:HAD-IA family hydrolase [Thermoanaerobaculia bacterium]
MAAPHRDYRLVVFDWDGTLIDSIGSIVACTEAALADAGVEPPPLPLLRGSIGLGLTDSFDRFYPALSAELRERILDRYRHHWVETWHARHDPFPATAATLVQLGEAGMLLAVATAKSRRGLVRDFERTGLGDRFHASRTLDECPPKPSPAMLLELMEELGTTPRQTLMVGDTRWDLEMASNAGVDAVAVLCGAQPEDELRGCRQLACLPHVGALVEWLGLAAVNGREAPSLAPAT